MTAFFKMMHLLGKSPSAPRRGERKSLSQTRGYTVVELMMGLSIFTIGVTGVVAMQSISLGANGHSKDLATATQLARSWQERLTMDALVWTGNNLDQSTWLNQVTTDENQWLLPASELTASGNFGPAAGALGEYVVETDAYFCTHIRLSRLIAEDNGVSNGGLLRSEVRVFWPKGDTAWNNGNNYCDPGVVATVGQATGRFHFVYNTTVIRQTPSF